MPDLDTLLRRLEQQGISRPRVKAMQKRLANDMWHTEISNYKLSWLGVLIALAGLAIVGGIVFFFANAIYAGLSGFADFPHGQFWITYWSVVLALTIGAAMFRPRSRYGIGRGPYAIADDPLFWHHGALGEWENLARIVLAMPNLLRMSLFNVVNVPHLRRLAPNADLALYVLLVAEKQIVAEEVLLIQKRKRAADLWSVLAALTRMEYIRHERIRNELLIWRGRAAERALGLLPEE